VSAAEFVRYLLGVRSTGVGEWTALCPVPAHDDKRPSLSIKQAADRTLLKCWAGCKPADVVTAIGLRLADLFDDSKERPRPNTRELRKRSAAEGLESWRQSELRRVAEELRHRDFVIRSVHAIVAKGEMTEEEAAILLEYEYRGYSELEYRFDCLLRNQDTLGLWRESRTA